MARLVITVIGPSGDESELNIDDDQLVHKCKVVGTSGQCPGDTPASALEIGQRICTNKSPNYHTPVTITNIV